MFLVRAVCPEENQKAWFYDAEKLSVFFLPLPRCREFHEFPDIVYIACMSYNTGSKELTSRPVLTECYGPVWSSI